MANNLLWAKTLNEESSDLEVNDVLKFETDLSQKMDPTNFHEDDLDDAHIHEDDTTDESIDLAEIFCGKNFILSKILSFF